MKLIVELKQGIIWIWPLFSQIRVHWEICYVFLSLPQLLKLFKRLTRLW